MSYSISKVQLASALARQATRRAEMVARAQQVAKARRRPTKPSDSAHNVRRREARALLKSDPQAALRRQQAGMTKKRCRCGTVFLRRSGSEVELCCGCAAEGLPPIPERWGNGHPLCKE